LNDSALLFTIQVNHVPAETESTETALLNQNADPGTSNNRCLTCCTKLISTFSLLFTDRDEH
jgi:hypothetical protein